MAAAAAAAAAAACYGQGEGRQTGQQATWRTLSFQTGAPTL